MQSKTALSPFASIALLAAFVTILTGCLATQPPVVERLDGQTYVTITNSRTSIRMAPYEVPIDAVVRDFVQIGTIEVNRQGARRYYVWLEIWDLHHANSAESFPSSYETIDFILDGAEMSLDVDSRTYREIGISKPIYTKYYRTANDAFYGVTVEQIRQLAEAKDIRLQTTGRSPKVFVTEKNQSIARNDLSEFLARVSR